jgi:glycosyltransferase involved in cell wall biosynthesis
VKVAVVGTRGIPGVHGGVERHCEELYPRLAALGVDVTVYARAGYVDNDQEYRGVHVRVLRAPRGKGIEALAHTARAMRQAARDGFDVLHVQSIGPSALIPYARVLGHRRVVTTVHAPDYLQTKWGVVGSAYLRLGERFAVRHGDAAISVSSWYADQLEARYGRRPTFIPNGPGLSNVKPSDDPEILSRLGLDRERYFLFVGRLTPDKRVEDLLVAAASLQEPMVVVVAGDTSDTDTYAERLRAHWSESAKFPGYVYGTELADLYAGAAALVLPSSVEGLPICLLEAMSFDTPVVASDIPANREVLDDGRSGLLYPVGDVDALRESLLVAAGLPAEDPVLTSARNRVNTVYSWDSIAERTRRVYEDVLGG